MEIRIIIDGKEKVTWTKLKKRGVDLLSKASKFLDKKSNQILAIGGITFLTAGAVSIALDRYAVSNFVKTCCALASGEDLAKADFDDETPLFLAENSIEALIAQCREAISESDIAKFSPDVDYSVTRSCVADSIKRSIASGVDVPRPLIEDARAENGDCNIIKDPFKTGDELITKFSPGLRDTIGGFLTVIKNVLSNIDLQHLF